MFSYPSPALLVFRALVYTAARHAVAEHTAYMTVVSGDQLMPAARFCSECGQRLKVKRVSRLPFGSFCARCSPRFQRVRLIVIAIPFLCAAIGFAIGHYTSSREPFYFIGTPVDLSANRVAPSAGDNNDHSSRGSGTLTQLEQLVISTSAAEAICGARTKSGKPCQRKVKGGGYCWQHRDRYAPNKEGSAVQ